MDERTHAVRLLRRFDVDRLRADLDASLRHGQVPQFGRHHNGGWTGLSLRSEGGHSHTTQTGLVPTGEPFDYTPVIRDTPYLREVLEGLACPLRSVRLLHLAPGGRIEPHVDSPLTFQHGILRLHTPIVTHPDVEFVIAGKRCDWQPGELWWGDFSLPHHVYNDSPINRVHLVIDVEINDRVLALFPADFRESRQRGGILLHRSALDLPPEHLRLYECDVEVPPSALPHPKLGAGGPVAFRVKDQRLTMLASDEVLFRLDPIDDDEFAVIGWSRAVTMRFSLASRRVAAVALVVRGLPRDLFAAESPDNPRLDENHVRFRVLDGQP